MSSVLYKGRLSIFVQMLVQRSLRLASNGAMVKSSKEMPYVRYFWELLPWFRKRPGHHQKTLKERDKELSVDSSNPASFWSDYRDLQKNHGKYFQASTTLFPPQTSRMIPSTIKGLSVLDGQHVSVLDMCRRQSATLLLLKFKEAGEPHLESYRKPLVKQFGSNSCLDVVFVERPIYRLLKPFIMRNLTARMPLSQQSRTIVQMGIMTNEKLQLNIMNSMVGWVYLLDSRGRVRWHAHGFSTPAEVDSMITAYKQLSAGK